MSTGESTFYYKERKIFHSWFEDIGDYLYLVDEPEATEENPITYHSFITLTEAQAYIETQEDESSC